MGYPSAKLLPRFDGYDVFVAAAAGALPSGMAISASASGDLDASGAMAMFSFAFGAPAIKMIGLPVARWLAAREHYSVQSGFASGAVCGALAGAALMVLLWFCVSAASVIPYIAMWGAMMGAVHGAFAGATLAWLNKLGEEMPS